MTILRSRATASLWKTWHCFTSLAADQRGQAMVEYSSLTFAILIGILLFRPAGLLGRLSAEKV